MSSEASQPLTDFGPNEWLVDELYQKYLDDPNSVDKAWWNFFADYKPDASSGAAGTANGTAPEAAAAQKAETAAAAPPTAPERTAPAAAEQAKAPAPPKAEPKPAPRPAAKPAADKRPEADEGPEVVRLRGAAARTAVNMAASLEVPTATSVRAVPAKLLVDNRIVINNHLRRGRGGKISFTHLIGFAVVRALRDLPEMNHAFGEQDGKPVLIQPRHVNLGLAIDVKKGDQRQLLVPNIKKADTLDFRQFWTAYEEVVRKARAGSLGVDDFSGTTISLTNPGTIGTVHSVPRLMQGQGTIVGVGAMEYPAEFQGASEETLSRLAVSKIMTLTSTYDHRIIQGAQSGDFLRRVHQLLLGEDGFYDEIFESLRIPYEPVRWVQDITVVDHHDEVDKGSRVHELIHAYRVRGHLMADTDPLEYKQRRHPDLDVLEHGLTLWDLEREFPTGGFGGKSVMKLRDILGLLRNSYCRTIGVEYMHIQSPQERAWLQKHIETPHDKPGRDEQLHILRKLNTAEAFETFLQTKYVGQKRFSLEGGESLIPLLDSVIASAADAELDEAVIGMAHRGRLNVLANICGKSYAQIFGEFEGNIDPRSAHGSGDVKYHLGTEGVYTAPSGREIKTTLAANPSHLEAVNPVAEGIVRAKQDLLDKGEPGFTVLPILVHGDAAFAGQGVVAETLNLSQLRGYRTGGTVHVVVNNQVGFTTSPLHSRSSFYSTDVARMIEAPIFHVNGDDPEAVVRVGRLAFEYRQRFKKDVVIDLVCYRRRGHNEAENPSFTQPLMYDIIDAKRSTRKLYTEALIGRGDITVEEAEQALRDYQEQLERAFTETREAARQPVQPGSLVAPAAGAVEQIDHEAVETAISTEVVKRVVDSQLNLPEGFTVHPRLAPQLQRRAQMVEEDTVDWAMGETLALGSLLIDGHPVRLVGQDTRRGTFGQRHSVLVDRKTGQEFTPLKQFDQGNSKFYVHDSLLSEFAAMGFEYGYSVVRPDALVAWEAQFGDFANGAQSILDEFISSGEQKWGQRSSVVLLLPHGFEGQGPDHSSARIERYLQLCAQNNMTVAMPTTAANYFHLLRWQVNSQWRRPLVVFTPKSLLRAKTAASPTAAFTDGHFRPLIPETAEHDRGAVRRVVLTSGKIYYDLVAGREERGSGDTAILRVERLYPLPVEEIRRELAAYPEATELVWVQEEPANMGPWPLVALALPEQLGRSITRVSRPASSSPAVGSKKRHDAEQDELVAELFPRG